MNHDTQATTNFSNDSPPILESIVFSLVKKIGAGTTHVLILFDNSFASCGVYEPVITALPDNIA
jgi:hypothetical protein